MIVSALAMTILFAQANETVNPESVTVDTVNQRTEVTSSKQNADTATQSDAEKKADEKDTEKH